MHPRFQRVFPLKIVKDNIGSFIGFSVHFSLLFKLFKPETAAWSLLLLLKFKRIMLKVSFKCPTLPHSFQQTLDNLPWLFVCTNRWWQDYLLPGSIKHLSTSPYICLLSTNLPCITSGVSQSWQLYIVCLPLCGKCVGSIESCRIKLKRWLVQFLQFLNRVSMGRIVEMVVWCVRCHNDPL